MWTALFGIISGILSGIMPDLIKEVKDTRQHQREVEFIERQAEAQIKIAQMGHDSKMREIEQSAFAEEMRASLAALGEIVKAQSKPSGYAWIDGYNALLRPGIITMLMALFGVICFVVVFALLDQFRAGTITHTELMESIFGSLIGESFLASFSFLFAYRSAQKKPRVEA